MEFLNDFLADSAYAVDRRIWLPLLSVILEGVLLLGIHNPPYEAGKFMATLIGVASVLFGTAPTKDFLNQGSSLGVIRDHNKLHSTYDFIVVGGGISGCLIARRLSDKDFSVLLVHGPGDTPSILTRIPLFGLFMYGATEEDFQYKGAPLETSHWKPKRITYNAGRNLGGAQPLSAQVWSYGKSGDFDCWKKFNISSDKFNYANIRKFGALHERKDPDIHEVDFEYGKQGEIHLSHPDEFEPFNKFATVFENEGSKITNTKVIYDHNSDELGFSRMIHAVERETGYVSTPTRAFFEKGYNRDKLHIITKHMVTRILFDTTTNPPRATGVTILNLRSNRLFNVYARYKVVLSGGAIRSPQLLTLSGVGPRDTLSRFDIEEVAVREGVGKNLHDHYDVGSAGVCFPRGTKRFVDASLWEIIKYARTGSGQLRAPYGTRSVGFFRSQTNLTTCKDPNDKETCRPDFEVISAQFGANTQLSAKHFRCSGATFKNIVNDFYMMGKNKSRNGPPFTPDDIFDPEDCLYFVPTLLHPEGRGEVTLTSRNILADPIVNLKPIANARDMRLYGELWQTVRKISNEGFSKLGGRFNEQVFDECRHIRDRNSIEFGTCQARPYMKTAWHMSGTCRLGHRSDPLAVVDTNFNVIGVDNLSLADGSLLPCPTSGHMLATTAALAEMAACQLLRDSNRPSDSCTVGVL